MLILYFYDCTDVPYLMKRQAFVEVWNSLELQVTAALVVCPTQGL